MALSVTIYENRSMNKMNYCISSQVGKFNRFQTSVEPYFQRHGLSWIREKFES